MAGPSEAEIRLLLTMNDQASSVLKGWVSTLGQAASGASQTAAANQQLGASFDNIIAKAKEAGTALAEVFGAQRFAKETVNAFAEYEANLVGISRTTKLTGDSLKDFDSSFRQLSDSLGSVPVDKLQHFSQIAGQLGLRGKADILGFTEAIGKLDAVFNIGEQGATQIGRLLLATGDLQKGGVDSIKSFANALAEVQTNTKTTTSELIAMTSRLAQTTQEFHVGSAALLGLGAAAVQLNFHPQLFGTAVQRSLIELRDNAIQGGAGMRQLSQLTGVTREQFLQLIQTNPTEALLLFAGALKKINDNKGSTTEFLTNFKLQAAQTESVLGTLAQNIPEVSKVIEESKKAASGNSLDQSFAGFNETTKAQLASLSNSFEKFSVTVGSGLGKELNPVFAVVTKAVGGLDSAFRALPDGVREIGVTIPVLAVGFAGLATALNLVFPSLGLIGGGFTLLTGPVGIGVAAVAGAALLIASNWETIKKVFSQPIGDSIKQGFAGIDDIITTTMKGAYNATKDGYTAIKRAFTGELDPDKVHLKELEQFAADLKAGLAKAQEAVKATPVDLKLEGTNQAAFNKILPNFGASSKVSKEQGALDDVKELFDQAQRQGGKLTNDGVQVTQEDIERAQRLLNIQKEISKNPLFKKEQALDDAIKAAQALTATDKATLEVQKQIRAEVEATGLSEEKVTASIRTRNTLLEQAKTATAVSNKLDGIQDQIQAAAAVTAEEKNRVEINKQINDFIKANVGVTEAQALALGEQLAVLKQIAEQQAVIAKYNPVAAARERLAEEIKVLQVLRDQGKITEEQYQNTVKVAQFKSQGATNPVSKDVENLREQIRISQLYGDQQKIEQGVLDQTNKLKEQGVVVTKELSDAVREYQTALTSLNKENSSGFNGFVRQVGTVQDQLKTIEGDFANGLSTAISGAITGQKGSFRKLFQNLGNELLNAGIKQTLAQSFTALGAGDAAKGFAGQANGALSKIDSLSGKQFNAQVVNVNASAVNIAGSGTGTGGLPGVTSPAGTTSSSSIPGAVSLPGTTSFASSSSAASIPSVSSIPTIPSVAPTLLPQSGASAPAVAIEKSSIDALSKAQVSPATASEAVKAVQSVRSSDVQAAAASASSLDNFKINYKPGLNRVGPEEKNPENFIVHHTGGGNTDSTIQTLNERNLGVQYTVDKGGNVFQLTPKPNNQEPHILPSDRADFQRLGAPSGVSNANSIGVEVQAKNDAAVTEAQKLATANLYEKLKTQYPSLKNVYGHGEVNPGHKEADEGKTITDYIRQKDALKSQGVVGEDGKLKTSDIPPPPVSERSFTRFSGIDQGRERTGGGTGGAEGGGAGGPVAGIDTKAATDEVAKLNTSLKQTGTSVQSASGELKNLDQSTVQVGQATQQAQTSLKGLDQSAVQTGQAASQAAPALNETGQAATQAGQDARQAGSSFQSAGSEISSSANQVKSAGSSASTGTEGFGSSLGALTGPLSAAKGGAASFGQSIISLASKLLSAPTGGGGGLGGLGGLGSLFGFADGGHVSGPGTDKSDSILAKVSNGEFIVNAKSATKNLPLLHAINNDKLPGDHPKFADGGVVGAGANISYKLGQSAAARSQSSQGAHVSALADQVNSLAKAMNESGGRSTAISQNITVNANDAGSFKRSEGQLTSDAFLKMNRAAKRFG